MLTRRAFSAAMAAGPLAAAPSAAARARRIEEPVSAAAVTELGGFAGYRHQANITNRISKFDIDRYVAMVEQKKHRDWWWIGEQPGKWLEAAILATASEPSAPLRTKAKEVLARLIAAQEPEGYLGITDPAIRTRRHPFRGMDPYELYFTLHALLAAHEYWSSAPALAAAVKLGAFFVAKVGPGKGEFWPLTHPVTLAGHNVHYSLEGTLLIDPMMRLYEASGEKRFLDWCAWVINSIDRWSVSDTYTNLDEVAAGRIHLNRIQPNVHAHTLHMNLLGLLRFYRATGDSAVIRKVQGAWRDIYENYSFITGGVSVAEGYKEPHALVNDGEVVETCASMSWLLLNQALLELTAEPKYAEASETLIWNHMFAAQTVDGDGFRYHCPLNGQKPAGYFTGPDCCSSSGARMLAQLPGFIYAQGREVLYVNQVVPSVVRLENFVLRQTSMFPASDAVLLEIAAAGSAPLSLRIRIPRWAQGAAAKINSTPVKEVSPGEYLELRHTWSTGDRVELRLPLQPEWIRGEYTNQGLVALRRGPVVYYMENPAPVDTSARLSVGAPVSDATGLGPEIQCGGARLTPFANLGQWYRSRAEKESTPPPADRRGLVAKNISYAVWLKQS